MLRSLSFPLALLLAASGCSGSQTAAAPDASADAAPDAQTVTTGEPVVLGLGDAVEIGGHEIRFVDVVEDSRCPEDVTCVWEGRAKVRLAASAPGAEPSREVLTLPYGAMTDDERDVWTVGGMTVRLLALSSADASRQVELSVTPG